MATFSVDNGLNVYCNNILIASNVNYKTPINHGFNVDEWELYPEFSEDIGLTGLLSVDL
ncbi:hypothetical protein [Acinetobacter halotolerans]|uniref:hypothetical protein n=1 Tax=Acinetobacter halotolerans TaxID=1752076 RepID=UPI0013EE4AE5|nr:hypothetical protein [Acinetobacter halotolerans]